MKPLAIGNVWIEYRLSPDAKTLKLVTNEGEATFTGIRRVAMAPVSPWQMEEEDKDLDEAVEYDLTKCRVPGREYFQTDLKINAAAIGPPSLRIAINDDKKTLRALRAFWLSGNYLAVTLICENMEFRKLADADE